VSVGVTEFSGFLAYTPYVGISRARHKARIYTNNLSRLPAAIARENKKHAALDLRRERQPDRLGKNREEGKQRTREVRQHQV
jgi:hypothetical protein